MRVSSPTYSDDEATVGWSKALAACHLAEEVNEKYPWLQIFEFHRL